MFSNKQVSDPAQLDKMEALTIILKQQQQQYASSTNSSARPTSINNILLEEGSKLKVHMEVSIWDKREGEKASVSSAAS